MKQAGFIAAVVIAAAGVAGTAVLAKGSHATFQELDADGNGEITQAEMEAHRTARFAKADADGDGKLSLDEAKAQAQEQAGKRAAKMFERHDANKDGFLDAEELPKPRRAGKVFDRMDKDGSGGISEAEFAEARERMKEHRKKRGHQVQD